MNDLLTDSFVSNSRGQPSRDNDIEMGMRAPRRNSDMGMDGFNKQIQEIEKQVDKLSALLKKLKDANEDSKSVTKASEMKAIKKRMEKDVDEVGKIARNVKAKLEAINRDNLANRQKPGCEKGTSIDRSRMNVTNALTKRFKELMTQFLTLRQRIQQEYREVVERRVITVTGTRPDEETIDHLIETGNSEQIFQKAIQEQGRGQVLNTLEEIQERHDAVKEIEKKLLDLQQIYICVVLIKQSIMSSIVQNFQKKTFLPTSKSLPVSQPDTGGNDLQQGLRRRLSSLSLKIQPISAQTTSWAFQRSKSVSSMGEYAGSSIRKWWDWSWSWILSRKPTFAQDLEMNEEETKVLGCHDKGSWRHVFYKVRSEIKKLMGSDKVGLPQTCKYNSFDYSKNFDSTSAKMFQG